MLSFWISDLLSDEAITRTEYVVSELIKFSKKLQNLLNESERKTKKNKGLQINLALNYGSKNEIINAVNKLNRLKAELKDIATSIKEVGNQLEDLPKSLKGKRAGRKANVKK